MQKKAALSLRQLYGKGDYTSTSGACSAVGHRGKEPGRRQHSESALERSKKGLKRLSYSFNNNNHNHRKSKNSSNSSNNNHKAEGEKGEGKSTFWMGA